MSEEVTTRFLTPDAVVEDVTVEDGTEPVVVDGDVGVIGDGAVVDDVVADDPQATLAHAHTTTASNATGRPILISSAFQTSEKKVAFRIGLCLPLPVT